MMGWSRSGLKCFAYLSTASASSAASHILASVPQFQPGVLCQKSIHAKIVENVSNFGDDHIGPNSSVAAMAAVEARVQWRDMDTNLQTLLMDPSRLDQQAGNQMNSNKNQSCYHNDIISSNQRLYNSQQSMSITKTNNGVKLSLAFTRIQTGLLLIHIRRKPT
ncbi:hypothetical protein TNCT_653831 [Trichonephila clavata]|uniref:Uncharacterized protein n=1 Tax=Trichonephila clavata TaxID=2740835 RepID=A0A8X6LFJ7_TRICU|nr:hypothetical protein TNCT_653831 [Trichonephila clavata]